MSKNRSDSLISQLRKAFVDLLRHAVVAEFDQQIVTALDGVAVGVSEHVLQIVVGEMEVASQADFQRAAD